MEKECSICNNTYTRNSNRQKYCSKKCTSYAFRQKRLTYIQQLKLKEGCVDCGYNKSPVALHFDHITPEDKKFSIGQKIHSNNWKLILEEIAKCEVRCANCHSIRTHVKNHYIKESTNDSSI